MHSALVGVGKIGSAKFPSSDPAVKRHLAAVVQAAGELKQNDALFYIG